MVLALIDGLPCGAAIQLLKLAHPASAAPCNFGIAQTPEGKVLLEIIRCEQEASSWFVGESVQSDGVILLCTRADPLLLALSILDKQRARLSPLSQILFPQATALMSCIGFDATLVCDVDSVGDGVYVRLSDAKTLAWLNAKVDRTKRALLQSAQTSREALSGRASNFEMERQSPDEARIAQESAAREAERKALQLVCDYLPDRLRDLLVSSRKWELHAVLASTATAAAATSSANQISPPKAEGSWEENHGYVVPRSEEHRKYTMGQPVAKKAKPAGPSAVVVSAAAQKKIEQAAKGSKKISSFFKQAASSREEEEVE